MRLSSTIFISLVLFVRLFAQDHLEFFERKWQEDSLKGDISGIYSKSQHYWDLGEDSLSAVYLGRALNIYRLNKIDNDTILGRSYVLYGLSIREEKIKESIDALLKGLAFYKKAYPLDSYRIHSLFFNLADKFFFSDDLTKAQYYLDTSFMLQIGKEKGRNWGRVLNHQALLYSYQGDIQKSLLYLKAAKPYLIRDWQDNIDYYKVLEAEIYREFDNYPLSIKALLEIPDNSSYTSFKYSQVAQAFISMEEYDSALYYLNMQRRLPTISPSENNWMYANMAIAYDLMGFQDLALDLYKHVEFDKGEGRDSFLHSNNLSNILFEAGDFDKSMQICSNLVEVFLNNKDIKPHDKAYFFSSYFDKLGRLARKDSHYLSNIDIVNLAKLVDSRIRELRGELVSSYSRREFSTRSRSLYSNLISVLIGRNGSWPDSSILMDVLQYIEATKSLVLQEEFAEKRAEESQKLKYRKKYEELEAMMENETDLDKRISISDSIFYWLQKEEQDTLVFENELASLTPDIPAFIEQRGVTYLNYFQHEDTSLTIVAIGNGQSFLHHLDNTDWYHQVENRLREIRNYSLGALDRYHETDSLLFNYILPFSDLRLPTKLVIVPDGILAYFPFEVLRDRKGSYLIEHTSISYSFSLAMLDQLQRYPSVSGVPLIMAPHFAGDVFLTVRSLSDRSIKLGALQFNRDEASEISSILRKSNLFLNEDASLTNFYAHCGESSIIHIATHAFASENEDQKAQIIFDEGTRPNTMYLSEIYNHKIPANLVVMSACQTAVGRYLPGEGVMSFARGFMAAGSKSVIASLWSVNDESTSEIMGNLYKNLKRGNSKDEALRMAKLNFINSSDPQSQHPFFWAGMIVIGDQSPIEDGANPKIISLIAGIVLLVSFFIYGFLGTKNFKFK